MTRAAIQRQVETQHVRRPHQLVEANVRRAVFLLSRQSRAVVVLDGHAEGAGSSRHGPADTAHAQDAERLLVRVVAQLEAAAAPLAFAHGGEWDRDAAQGAEHEEEGDVGGGFVDGDGGG